MTVKTKPYPKGITAIITRLERHKTTEPIEINQFTLSIDSKEIFHV